MYLLVARSHKFLFTFLNLFSFIYFLSQVNSSGNYSNSMFYNNGLKNLTEFTSSLLDVILRAHSKWMGYDIFKVICNQIILIVNLTIFIEVTRHKIIIVN